MRKLLVFFDSDKMNWKCLIFIFIQTTIFIVFIWDHWCYSFHVYTKSLWFSAKLLTWNYQSFFKIYSRSRITLENLIQDLILRNLSSRQSWKDEVKYTGLNKSSIRLRTRKVGIVISNKYRLSYAQAASKTLMIYAN